MLMAICVALRPIFKMVGLKLTSFRHSGDADIRAVSVAFNKRAARSPFSHRPSGEAQVSAMCARHVIGHPYARHDDRPAGIDQGSTNCRRLASVIAFIGARIRQTARFAPLDSRRVSGRTAVLSRSRRRD